MTAIRQIREVISDTVTINIPKGFPSKQAEIIILPVDDEQMTFTPIGVIHSPFQTKDAAPIQGAFVADTAGQVELFPEYEEGLKDIELFSHLILMYRFDRAEFTELVRQTFLDDTPHGVFASRHPCRPNGLGMTVVRMTRRERNVLHVAGIDVLDGTPLLDVKPYVPRFDCFPDANEGWVATKQQRQKPEGRE